MSFAGGERFSTIHTRYALEGVLTSEFDLVVHLAASKAVNSDNPGTQFKATTQMAYNVLETIHVAGVSELAYPSGDGEAPRSTAEDDASPEPSNI